ncbi:capsular associated protein [Colletotrichum truncatum]|uniref:Capsular associated protein n=1 Tax=Colletotrichum truncatum TaxID=5467 RepID=A0ACC3YSY1_COLTU|nr:capsular associated protein [Colletotrichum truncatum]KAF6785117.1 capsular associated protein [Colletotrichum truncatum]
MARDVHVHLTAICVVVSFSWISYNFERHALVEWPRLSSVLIFVISGALTWLASYLSKWLPGADGRFDESKESLKGTFEPSIPARPRRYFIPLLVFLIFLRLELFHRVTAQLQCSTPGVQSFLCSLLVFYDIFFCRRPSPPQMKEQTPWDSPLDDLLRWLNTAPITMLVSTVIFGYGTFLAVGQGPRSTYFCSAILDSWISTLALQLLGLLLDAAIAIVLHRILSWTKTTKLRLKTLGAIQALTGVFIKIFQILISPFVSSSEGYPSSLNGVDSLYFFDIFIDSFTFSVLVSLLTILVCETSPAMPASIITFVSGMSAAIQNITRIGAWHIPSKSAAIMPTYLLYLGFSIFLYTSNMRSVLFIRRSFIVALLPLLLVGMTVFGFLKSDTVKGHPIEGEIYNNRIQADRWLRLASTSDSLRVAAQVYQERHYGRDPPPNFDKWYEFAKERKSVIIDHFEQMESDILPFWGIKPETIRQAYNDKLLKEQRMAVITIQNKKAAHNYKWDDEHRKMLDELINTINLFVVHLSDMKIPINLADQPRVLTPWSDLTRYTTTGKNSAKKFKLLSSRSVDEPGGQTAAQPPKVEEVTNEIFIPSNQNLANEVAIGLPPVPPQSSAMAYASTKAFRESEASVCPAGSPGRSGLHWNIRDFCSSCVKYHSDNQLIWSWAASKSLCEQQDITRLHSFHMSAPKLDPIRELLPVFSRSKADGFNDILIPLPPLDNEVADVSKQFRQRKDELYWRGTIGEGPISDESLRGSHKSRLVHLINNATAADQVTMMVLAPAQKDYFGYEIVRATEANKILPFNIGISDYACEGPACDVARAELGQRAGNEDPLEYRYVFLLDEDSGPPKDLLRTIRSPGSVPVLTSVFGEWYSERLIPWLHFVPIDLRYHALHTTMAYFFGLKDRGKVNGRNIETESRWEDGEWIATQGKRWADQAIRKEDMEIYLFRLLLEWGRVVSDDRDSIGFRLEKS